MKSLLAALLLGLAACGPSAPPASKPAAAGPPGSAPESEAQESGAPESGAPAPASDSGAPEASPEPLEAPGAPPLDAPAKAAEPAPAMEPQAETQAVASASTEVPAAFARCRSCHTVAAGGAHGVGPNLAGVMGAEVGSRSGYAYSAAMAESDQIWTPELMDAFLLAPRGAVPGTKMMAAPVREPADRQALIAYLASLR